MSIFENPVWIMDDVVTTPGIHSYQKYWDFRTLPGFPGGFALSLAEYAYARLYTPVVTHEREGNWLTVHNELSALSVFAKFCDSEGLSEFHEVDTSLCERFLKNLQFSDEPDDQKSDDRIRFLVKLVYRLWEYRSVVSDAIPVLPFGRPFEKIFKRGSGCSREGNATPVIPEPVYAAITASALDYVLIYSPIILETWVALQKHWDEEIAPLCLSQSMKYKRLSQASKPIISQYKAHWLTNGWLTRRDVYTELQQLRKACTIVVLAYSGIRLSELLSLKAGCYVIDECEDGHPRYYINTVLHKHREKGSRDTWVVIDEVVQAIKVLELLTARIRVESNDDRLMLTDGTNHLFSVHRSYVGEELSELTGAGVIHQLNAFQIHCNNKLHRSIPEWTDEDGVTGSWHFNTRHFRRTLARYIARQPFGVIAGMIQYKHVEAAIFQGYAGSEPEWNKLLAQEKVLASVDILEEVALDLSNGQLAGDFGSQLKEEFATEFRGRAEDFAPSQIAKWLANRHKTLFVGKFNFCFFDPCKALCTQEDTSNKPILNFCQPEKCPNACIGKRHISKWRAQLIQAEELAGHPKTSHPQRVLLLREAMALRAVVDTFEKESHER